jgi:hypothetical protein
VLRIEKLKFNIHNLVHYKDKSQNIKLIPDNTIKGGKIDSSKVSVPSLNDMEFNWIEDY